VQVPSRGNEGRDDELGDDVAFGEIVLHG
jgi:hypothetical protein